MNHLIIVNNSHIFRFKKSFRHPNRPILFHKLNLLGFKGITLKLLDNYLSDRLQSTKLNNIISETMTTVCGVPQRSTLGPLLFILYINDLPLFFHGIKIKLYTDDTIFYLRDPQQSYCELVCTMSKAAERFLDWCDCNRLTINLKKSKMMVFTNRNKNIK